MLHHLSIDIETRSSVPIGKAGLYKYAQSKDFRVLLFAYSLDGEPVDVIDLAQGEHIPQHIVDALADPVVVKHAYNAAFEWYCLNQAGYKTPLNQWQCTMAHGMYCGYPAGLEAAGKTLGLPQDKQKLSTGKALIRYFCVPARPTRSNGGRRWNEPQHDPDKWRLFVDYCAQDVVTEMAIEDRLVAFPVPETEWLQWRLTTAMNAHGVRVDEGLVRGALDIDARSRDRLVQEAMQITGVDNPNSTSQLLEWLNDNVEAEVTDVRKATVADLLETDQPEDVRRMLEIRQQLGKTSVSKYKAMEEAACADGYIRGLTQYYGANRTGRWAGRLVQMQNLPRNYLSCLDEAREMVRGHNIDGIRAIFGNVPDTLSQLIRTAFIPSEGRKFVVADFSAIEARVIAWLAGEDWVNEVFRTHGKIYEATASQMFGVPVERIAKGSPEYSLRQKGKVATLALGYQGGTSALIAMGALKMGIPEEDLPDIVTRWRQANPHIVALWRQVEDAAVAAVQTAQLQDVRGLLTFRLEGEATFGQMFLTVELPSKRKLYYPEPSLEANQFGKLAVHFSAAGTAKKWGRESTYGGKLTENIVQATARDCLAVTLERIDAAGLQTVFHVHDEVIVDAPMETTVEEVCGLMAQPIPWAPGLVLKGAGFEGSYYQKD